MLGLQLLGVRQVFFQFGQRLLSELFQIGVLAALYVVPIQLDGLLVGDDRLLA